MGALTVGGVACLLFADIVAGLLRSRIRVDCAEATPQSGNSNG
ncbi:hypothetical protein ACPCTO_37750 [Streptomyces olivoreticuli]